MNLPRGLVAVCGCVGATGCLAFPADFAIERASKEFNCPPEKIGVIQRTDISDYVYDLDACSQRARYACLSFAGDDLTTLGVEPTQCVREPDPAQWDPDPGAISSLPRSLNPIQHLRSTPGEGRRVCEPTVDRYADDCIFRERGSWHAHAKEEGAVYGMTHQ